MLCTAAGFQDRPDHSHEGARLVPVKPRGLLRSCRPVEAGVGEGCPGPCQPPVHPTACCQVGQLRTWFRSEYYRCDCPQRGS